MKRLLLFLLLASSAQAGITNVFHLEDFTAQPQKVRQFLLYPIPPSRTNGTGGIITIDRIVRSTGTNGTVTITNMHSSGGGYRSELIGTTTTTTNYFVFPATNGTINASDWMTNFIPAGVFAYSKADADARFVNITNQNTVNTNQAQTIASKFFSYNLANGHITNGGPSATTWGPVDINTNLSARLFIGNGVSITNIHGTNVSLATADQQGTVTSNQFALLSVPPFTQGDPDYDLPMMVETWYSSADHDTWTSTDASNVVSQNFDNGMTQLGHKYFILDDFWQGGRTNGHIIPNVRWASALTNGNLAAHLHSKGAKLILYTQPESITVSSHPGIGGVAAPTTNAQGEFTRTGDYYVEDMTDFIAWGVDGIKFDPQSVDYTWRLAQTRKLAATWRSLTTRPLWLLVDAGGFNAATRTVTLADFNPCEMLSVANVVRVTQDSGPPGVWNAWKIEEGFFEAVARFGHCARPGHVMYIEHGSFIGQGNAQYWEYGKGITAMRAMLHSPFSTATWDIAGDADRWFGMTNRNILRIQNDANYKAAELVISNVNALVFKKRLADGTVAATLWNRNTNIGTTTTITVSATNFGLNAGQLYGRFNCWSNTIEPNFVGSFSMTLTNISAETFFIYPTNGQTLVETWFPHQIFFDPAADAAGSGNSGPGAMQVENTARVAATTDMKFFVFPPVWATNLTLAYALQSDQTVSFWTNNFVEFQWDVNGARGFGSTVGFNVNGNVGTLQRFTNTLALTTHHPMAVRVDMVPGTNTTGFRYLLGPITATWRGP